MIKDFTPRLYQETVFYSSTKSNSLVVLPTGMGKTSVALMLIAHRLTEYPDSRAMVLAPTKPLADQIRKFLSDHLEIENDKIKLFTGIIAPEKRGDLYKKTKIIVSTPQTVENDILRNTIDLSDISLCVFDEAHRATGDYAYGYIAEEYEKKSKYPRILALTASPGSELEKIKEVCENLKISTIEVRTEKDPDVRPYIQKVNMTWETVKVPEEFSSVSKYLKGFIKDKLTQIKDKGYAHETMIKNYTKRDLLGLQGKLRADMSNNPKNYDAMKAISLTAEVMKIEHAIELLESQGITSLFKYLEKLERDGYSSKTKAAQNVVKDLNFRSAYIKAKSLYLNGVTHPKMDKLKELVEEEIRKNPKCKIIVFNQYRDNAVAIVDLLNQLDKANANLFVGQAKKNGTGLSQKEQLSMIDNFRDSEFNILVSSSVGEEGLDIPAVDVVIFYEPIPSAIRHIQRRGRTARLEKGKVVVLVAKGTRDEGYRWSAFHKENRMHRILDNLKKEIGMMKQESDIKNNKQVTLDSYDKKENITIHVDSRETKSGVVKQLRNLNINMKIGRLDTGDYILSSRVCVEFKTTEDFIDSLLDKRILMQAKAMRQVFARPVIIVQGKEDIYSIRNVHPHSIMGLISSLNVSFGIPIIYTKDEMQTAKMLYFIAKKEQEEKGSSSAIFSGRKAQNATEQQEQIVGSIPGIGGALAKPLLKRFGSIKNIVNASIEELKEVEKVGKIKAEKIKNIFNQSYQ